MSVVVVNWVLIGRKFYNYYLKDYQGNNCVVLNQNGVVQQINHYYPYGSLMGEGYNVSSQSYRYGGKELVTLGGLNLSDFGARWLDSPSGTFTTMDPLCEDFQHLSPYLYCAGNPIKYIDPSGMVAESVWDLVILGYDLYSAVDNLIKGDHKAAINNCVDVTADIVALLIPGVPAGVTKIDDGVKAVKDIEKLDSKYKNIPNPKNAGEGKKTTQAQRKKF